MTTMKWIPAKGFEGIYEVSDSGDVRRVLSAMGATSGKILKPFGNSRGYMQLALRRNGRYERRYVHRLVLESFTNQLQETVNHKNGIKTDNRLSNLEWCSSKENLTHACRVLGKRRGRNHWASKLDEAKVKRARQLAAEGVTHEKIAAMFGLSRISVTCAILRRTWKHVP
jgi:hypothetical protein